MGRTTLLLLTLAAPALRAQTPPAMGPRAVARLTELVEEGRKEQAGLSAALDELRLLSQSYEWESDFDAAEAKRAELRGRVGKGGEALAARLTGLSEALRRHADEHGLETLERLSDARTQGSADITALIRAQTFQQQWLAFAARVDGELRLEEDAWRRFRLLEAERRRFSRLIWGLALVFLAALAAVVYFLRGGRRRPPPPNLRGHRKGDVIDLRPE
jgi:hypothetical protein